MKTMNSDGEEGSQSSGELTRRQIVIAQSTQEGVKPFRRKSIPTDKMTFNRDSSIEQLRQEALRIPDVDKLHASNQLQEYQLKIQQGQAKLQALEQQQILERQKKRSEYFDAQKKLMEGLTYDNLKRQNEKEA